MPGFRQRGFRLAEPTDPTFLIWAPRFSHRSAGVRALYRLCHHLNEAGFSAAMVTQPGRANSGWNTPEHTGPVGDAIVIYPEIASGNPLGAKRVVRWAMNTPGLLGGETHYAPDEMVFVYDAQKLEAVEKAVGHRLGPKRLMWVSVIDPDHIYPDPTVEKTLNVTFTHKGMALAERFPPPVRRTKRLEQHTPTMAALGDLLRRTKTLYSYDHYSNLLREAHISGCDIRVVDETGRWHDPRTCDCALNIVWEPNIETLYADRFRDGSFVARFVGELRTRWNVPGPGPKRTLRRMATKLLPGRG